MIGTGCCARRRNVSFSRSDRWSNCRMKVSDHLRLECKQLPGRRAQLDATGAQFLDRAPSLAIVALNNPALSNQPQILAPGLLQAPKFSGYQPPIDAVQALAQFQCQILRF